MRKGGKKREGSEIVRKEGREEDKKSMPVCCHS